MREDRTQVFQVKGVVDDTCACVEGRVSALRIKVARIAIGTSLLFLPYNHSFSPYAPYNYSNRDGKSGDASA